MFIILSPFCFYFLNKLPDPITEIKDLTVTTKPL